MRIRIALAFCVSLLLSAGANAAEPIKIGVVSTLTGPYAEWGTFQVNGLKLALEEIQKAGGILGRPVELRIEDNASTNPGTVLAFTKLFTDPEIKGIVGPIASTQIQAASPAIAKSGIPTMIGGTDPSLTRINNKWVFHSPDFAPVVLAVKKSGAEVLGTYMTAPSDQPIFAKQLRQLGVNIQWIGSPTTAAVTTRSLAGEALYGSYAVADFNADANEAAREFTKRYRERYGIYPDNFSSWAYDALHILALAMNNANSTEPEAVRKAILAIKGYKGLEGTYKFDARGDGVQGYNVVKNEGGQIVFIKRVDFPVE